MKKLLILGILFLFFLYAFTTAEKKISVDWQTKTDYIHRHVVDKKVSKFESFVLKYIHDTRTDRMYSRIDSLYKLGYTYIYIVEEYNIITTAIKRTEKYFSPNLLKFYYYYSSDAQKDTSIQIPNLIFKDDVICKSLNNVDPFYKDNYTVIKQYWEALDTVTYVVPIVEETLVTPGCTGTHFAFIRKEKEMKRKYSKPIIANIYRIESLIDKEEIKLSFQTPKKVKPIIHVYATTF